MRFIKVRTSEGEMVINSEKIELITPKKYGEGNGCSVRMNAQFFIKVYESMESVMEKLNK